MEQSNAPNPPNTPSEPSFLPFTHDSELNSIFSLPTLIKVTLIAMANVRPTFVSLLHMFGAILLAFGTELNKQSLWVFLAPALTGICIISVSWGMKCRKKKQLYPSKKYLALYLPLGSVLVMIGLVSDTWSIIGKGGKNSYTCWNFAKLINTFFSIFSTSVRSAMLSSQQSRTIS